jgi:hypothetical protein
VSNGFFDQHGTWVPQREPGPRLADLPVVAWVSCYRCGGDLFIPPHQLPASSGLPGDGPEVYCAKCKPIVDAERAARPCVPGARAVHVSYPRGPFADMVVREVKDGRVRVSRLGAPDGVPAGADKFHHTVGLEWFTRGELVMVGQ